MKAEIDKHVQFLNKTNMHRILSKVYQGIVSHYEASQFKTQTFLSFFNSWGSLRVTHYSRTAFLILFQGETGKFLRGKKTNNEKKPGGRRMTTTTREAEGMQGYP